MSKSKVAAGLQVWIDAVSEVGIVALVPNVVRDAKRAGDVQPHRLRLLSGWSIRQLLDQRLGVELLSKGVKGSTCPLLQDPEGCLTETTPFDRAQAKATKVVAAFRFLIGVQELVN